MDHLPPAKLHGKTLKTFHLVEGGFWQGKLLGLAVRGCSADYSLMSRENAGGLNLQNVLGLSPLGLQWYYNETTVLTNSYSKYIRHAPFMTGIIAICCTVSAL